MVIMGRIARYGGAIGLWTAKRKIVITDAGARVSWVRVGSDPNDWSGVRGSVGFFVDGYSNPVEPPRPYDCEDSPDDTDWISTQNYRTQMEGNVFRDALAAAGADEIMQTLRIGFLSVGVLLALTFIAASMGGF